MEGERKNVGKLLLQVLVDCVESLGEVKQDEMDAVNRMLIEETQYVMLLGEEAIYG